jgi:hypothetical protein
MIRAIVAALFVSVSAPAYTASPQNVCGMGPPCRAGSQVVTYADKANPFYACPTRELSDYIGTVMGLVAAQSMLGGLPNLSPQTGEPEWQGETETMVAAMRKKARVVSFDQAVSQCTKGRRGIRAVVLNHEDGAMSIWVVAKNGSASFWAPASAFSPARP